MELGHIFVRIYCLVELLFLKRVTSEMQRSTPVHAFKWQSFVKIFCSGLVLLQVYFSFLAETKGGPAKKLKLKGKVSIRHLIENDTKFRKWSKNLINSGHTDEKLGVTCLSLNLGGSQLFAVVVRCQPGAYAPMGSPALEACLP